MGRWGEVDERDATREPCPDRIVEDLGGAFGMGTFGGFIWHFVKGARNSPAGDRWTGALFAAKGRSPILGGNFAVWGGTFSAVDCSLQYVRQRDDHWNAIASGFVTGGVLAARGGVKSAGRNALIGGVLLALIEGVSSIVFRSTASSPREQTMQMIEQERQMEEYRKEMEANGGQGGGIADSWNKFWSPAEQRDSDSKKPASENLSGFVSDEDAEKFLQKR
eukprot:GEMP01018515.1.p2 GENE.GEMP01018515.1~~GEMP01018515.1.p2  ORF type:complete len:221 (+),score=50.66 GEMP01018515.1:46-708(+)